LSIIKKRPIRVSAATEVKPGRRRIAEEALADAFGIEIPEEGNLPGPGPLSALKRGKLVSPRASGPLAEKPTDRRGPRFGATSTAVPAETGRWTQRFIKWTNRLAGRNQ
jgi:hypothetical protein